MDKFLSDAANAAQLLGLHNMKSVLAVVTLALAWQVISHIWMWRGWPPLPLSAGWRVVFLLALFLVSLLWWVSFIRQKENLVKNHRFFEDTRYWGTGYAASRIAAVQHWPEGFRRV